VAKLKKGKETRRFEIKNYKETDEVLARDLKRRKKQLGAWRENKIEPSGTLGEVASLPIKNRSCERKGQDGAFNSPRERTNKHLGKREFPV